MYEKPSQWLKRAQEKEPEQPEEAIETEPVEPEEEPAVAETRAEYRSQLKRMVEKILAAQKEDPPSPEEELGDERA